MSSTLGQQTMADTGTSPADTIEASRVSGTGVYNTDGEKLGHIQDIVIGKRDGQVKYAVLSAGGFLGIGEEYHPLPWHILKYDERQGGYVIGVTIDQLQGAPRYGREANPRWEDPSYGQGIEDYWGLRPAV